MMLRVDKEVLQHLGRACDSRATTFVLMCAERVKPVISTFGSVSASHVVDDILDSMWASLGGGAFDGTLAEQRIRALPEASIDDSHDPAYYAMIALGLVVDAIHAMSRVDPALVTSASVGALDLAGDLWFRVREVSGCDNRLEAVEGSNEIEAAALLGALPPENTAGALVSLRELARQQASAFAEAAQTLAAAWT